MNDKIRRLFKRHEYQSRMQMQHQRHRHPRQSPRAGVGQRGGCGWKTGGKAAREIEGVGKGVALGRSLYSLIRAVVRYERW